jgi:two-component system, OmpR family, response regulator ResD
MKDTVLAIDDDQAVLDLLKPALERAGLRVLTAASADEAVSMLRTEKVDMALLDVQLPGLSGFQLLEILKKDPATARLPVIMLTNRGEEKSRLQGLRGGADDYVVKPFSVAELAARVEALFRRVRHAGDPGQVVTAGPFRLDEASREAFLRGEALPLTETEFRLLSLLARHPGRVVSRESLARDLAIGGKESSVDTVYVHVGNLRQKLGKAQSAVQSVHGIGYKLVI